VQKYSDFHLEGVFVEMNGKLYTNYVKSCLDTMTVRLGQWSATWSKAG